MVDPMIGTGAHGHTTPAACLPYGMVQLGPDTDTGRWDACSGYHHDDPTIMGFSHNHLSGTGASDLMDVLVVPRVGPVVLNPGTRERPESSYRQVFDHADEHAEPGYYAVRLRDSGIAVELTATMRTGLHRYRFSGPGHLLIDFAHGARVSPDAASLLDDPSAGTDVTEASLQRVGADLIVGSRHVHEWADGRQIHFAMRLSCPIAAVRFFDADIPAPDGSSGISGALLKMVIMLPDAGFHGTDGAPVMVKVGLSGVDVAGAIANLDSECPDWDFDRVRGAARESWAERLGRVRVMGGTPDQQRTIASALYHTAIAPNLFVDSDGRYRGLDSAVHHAGPGEINFSTYSLWDTFRAAHPLLMLIDPEQNLRFVRNLVAMTQESPFGPPIWPLQGIETHCMIGWHVVVIIAEALVKGGGGFDVAALWQRLRTLAFDDDRHGLVPYRQLGYIPADTVREAASKTLEYGIDDWAMAVIADAAGAHDDAAKLRARSHNWRSLYDPQVGFVRPKLANGDWAEPFDPRALGHDSRHWPDFTECNAWAATFLAQHDIYGLVDLMGGDAGFEARLDALFAADSGLLPDSPPDISGMVGQYAQGNEPSHHVAYLYAWCGAPWKTQARVRAIMASLYSAAPEGLPGNDDCGQMSAWYVLSALGIYPVDPVSGIWVLGSPLFPHAELTVAGGRLVIEAMGLGPDAVFVQSVRWNGQVWNRSWIAHAELARGGHLVFEMGRHPNREFGHAPESRPPRIESIPLT
jgi:predicted alpha-1,2-mannosidase